MVPHGSRRLRHTDNVVCGNPGSGFDQMFAAGSLVVDDRRMRPQAQLLLDRFHAAFAHVDETTLVLLKGHLLIEEALTEIIELHTYHHEHLDAARLSFNQKTCVARALAFRRADIGEWELIQAINALRNDLAHRLESEEREKKFARLREVYLREAQGIRDFDEQATLEPPALIANACALVLGVLSSIHEDSNALRGFIHSLDRTLNPDLEPFERELDRASRSKKKSAKKDAPKHPKPKAPDQRGSGRKTK